MFLISVNESKSQDCSISWLTANIVDCTDDDFYVVLYFNYDYVSDSFYVTGNGNHYGVFDYSEVPLTLGPFPTDSTPYKFSVIDNDILYCGEYVDLGVIDCSMCEIYNITLENINCQDSTYDIILNFEHENVSDSFEVGHSHGYSVHAYGDLPVTLDSFPTGECNGFDMWIFDRLDSDCGKLWGGTGVICDSIGACELYNAVARVGGCTSSDTYEITFDIESAGRRGDSFDIFIYNINYFGTYAYTDLPLRIDSFPTFNQLSVSAEFVDRTYDCCLTFVGWQAPDCPNIDRCNIWAMSADVVNCIDDEFYVMVDLDYANTSDSFRLRKNSSDYGRYSYSSLPLLVGPFIANSTYHSFFVFDLDSMSCFESYQLGQVNCDSTTACEYSNLTVEFQECTSDTSYIFLINFDHQGTSDAGFNLYANGDSIGLINYDDLPILAETSNPSLTSFDQFLVCDSDESAACCAEVSIPTPNCLSGLHNTLRQEGLEVIMSKNKWRILVDEPGLIAIYDLTGRQIRRNIRVNDEVVITDIVSGTYVVTWTGSRGIISKKAVFFE